MTTYTHPNEKILKAILIVCIVMCNILVTQAQNNNPVISTGLFDINLSKASEFLWTYKLKNAQSPVYIKAPVFEINNKTIAIDLRERTQ